MNLVGASYLLHAVALWFVSSTPDTSRAALALPPQMLLFQLGFGPGNFAGNQWLFAA
jgi:hypothetical protein